MGVRYVILLGVMAEILLTPDGHRRLQQELEELRTVKRREVADQLRQARALGDLRENFAYDDAKRQQAVLEGRIKDLQYIMDHAKVVERPDGATNVIHLGSSVKIFDLTNERERELTIVGSFEADPLQDRISVVSPVGKSLIGRSVGDEVDVETPKGIVRYRIENVE